MASAICPVANRSVSRGCEIEHCSGVTTLVAGAPSPFRVRQVKAAHFSEVVLHKSSKTCLLSRRAVNLHM
jgi:hypothetical protein